MALDKNKIVQSGKYIELVKKTAGENLRIINLKGKELKSAILKQEQEFIKGNSRFMPLFI
jgi:hypothetical protein